MSSFFCVYNGRDFSASDFVSGDMTIVNHLSSRLHEVRSREISYNYPYGRDFSIALEMTIVFILSGCLRYKHYVLSRLREGDMTL